MTFPAPTPAVLDSLRVLLARSLDLPDYYEVQTWLNQVETACSAPVLIFRRTSPGRFEIGLGEARVAPLVQRAGSNAIDELHQVLAAGGRAVTLPGTPSAAGTRLRAAIDGRITLAGGATLGTILAAGLHVGKGGAWFDYPGVLDSIITR